MDHYGGHFDGIKQIKNKQVRQELGLAEIPTCRSPSPAPFHTRLATVRTVVTPIGYGAMHLIDGPFWPPVFAYITNSKRYVPPACLSACGDKNIPIDTDQTVGVPWPRAAAGTLHIAAFVRLVAIATSVALVRAIDSVH